MFQSMPGVFITLTIILLMGVIIGFYLRQARINQLTEALKRSQQRQDELQSDHQQRLQEATRQLQQDYAAQLAEKIEIYQQKHQDQINRLEAEYQSRRALTPSQGLNEPLLKGIAAVAGDGTTVVEAPVEVETQIRHQYEIRLREVAAKIQGAYEQQLRVKLAESRDSYHQEYEKRLAEKIEHYQDQLTRRTQELEQEFENRLQFLQRSTTEAEPLSPSESGQNLEDLINAAIDSANGDENPLTAQAHPQPENPTNLTELPPL